MLGNIGWKGAGVNAARAIHGDDEAGGREGDTTNLSG